MHSAGDQLTHYRLVERLGETRREIWKAVDTRDDRAVSIKVLPHLADSAALERLRRDADALSSIKHPAIVTIDADDEADGIRFVCTEPVDGTSLAELVPRGGLEPAHTLGHAVTLADALAAAHEAGVTHRDLGPTRVFAVSGDTLRIHDFGLSDTEEGCEDPNLDPDDTPTLTLTREGARRNLAYLSPEQIKNHSLDQSTDIYSLGAILYWMSTGVHPFRGDSPADLCVAVLRDIPRPVTQLKHDVPEGFGPIVERCLAKERDQRYGSARDLHAELAKLA
jgi:serine/threonine protein kinase